MSQGKTYTFQRQGLENTIISVIRDQGKSVNFFSKTYIHPGINPCFWCRMSFIAVMMQCSTNFTTLLPSKYCNFFHKIFSTIEAVQNDWWNIYTFSYIVPVFHLKFSFYRFTRMLSLDRICKNFNFVFMSFF